MSSIGAISFATSSLSASMLGNSYDREYEEIKRKLISLGITPSGNKSVDKVKLEQAQKEQKQKSIKKSQSTESQKSDIKRPEEVPQELKNILSQLSLTSTGYVEKDCENAKKAIQEKLASAIDENQKKSIKNINEQLDRFIAKHSILSDSASAMVGASALADINRQMLLGS